MTADLSKGKMQVREEVTITVRKDKVMLARPEPADVNDHWY